jgi:hypothetical protein
MNSATEDIKDKLIAAGEGTYAAQTSWGIFINEEPPGLSETISLFDMGGASPDRVMDAAKQPTRHPDVTIRVRATTDSDAHAKIVSVVKTLRELGRFGVGTVRYAGIFAGEPRFLEITDDKKFIWTVSVTAHRHDTA